MDYTCLNKKLELTVSTDASFADSAEKYKSTGGHLIFLGGNLVSWSSKRLKLVTTSTCTSEYVAANVGIIEAIYLAEVLLEVFGLDVYPVKAFMDNTAAEAILSGSKNNSASKYLGSKLHQLQQFVEHGKLVIVHVDSDANLADGLTKSLGDNAHQALVRAMQGWNA